MARPSARRWTKRGPREWVLRGGLAGTALAIGYLSTAQTLAFVLHRTDTERAYALSPSDGRVAGQLAQKIAAGEPDNAQRTRVTRLARQALIDEPLATAALTALALSTQLSGNTAQARRLFAHSDSLSRRELGTRLWLIEDAVGRNDIAGALHHYDIALRTSKAAPDLLFPILARAAANPDIAKSLAVTIARRPAWGETFVQFLGSAGTEPAIGAAMFRRLAILGYRVSGAAQTGVVNALVDKGAFDEAWRYYASIRPGAVRNRSRDSSFTAQLETPSVFDWTPIMNDTGVTASIQRTREGGIFDFTAPSTVGGLVLQQVQFLPTGRYRLYGISMEVEQGREALPYWQLSCLDGRELGRVDLRNSAEANGRFVGEFTVGGSNCAVQTLRLIARASTAIGGVTGQIKRVSLAPLEARP